MSQGGTEHVCGEGTWVWMEEAGEEETGRRREGLGRELLEP